MSWKSKGAALMAAFLYAQGLLGFGAVSAVVLRNAPWPTSVSGYGVGAPAGYAAGTVR